ncbi:hypothetical protein QJS10_CPB22g00108 [Acorus calamus]|uniref:Uncharacterized protein n=1 Tax=Acorus calamus TaxID=4465 RepID=A0AAV9BZ26_ACOCL|nr:hypothetical protein QJS10_CPB22g00108 [Acorus calamus]
MTRASQPLSLPRRRSAPPPAPVNPTHRSKICDSQSGQHVRGLDAELLVIVELVECNG